jgi:hypothetical protein
VKRDKKRCMCVYVWVSAGGGVMLRVEIEIRRTTQTRKQTVPGQKGVGGVVERAVCRALGRDA